MSVVIEFKVSNIEEYEKIVEKHKEFLEWQEELDHKHDDDDKGIILPPQCCICNRPIAFKDASKGTEIEDYEIMESGKGATRLQIVCKQCADKKRMII